MINYEAIILFLLPPIMILVPAIIDDFLSQRRLKRWEEKRRDC